MTDLPTWAIQEARHVMFQLIDDATDADVEIVARALVAAFEKALEELAMALAEHARTIKDPHDANLYVDASNIVYALKRKRDQSPWKQE